MKIQFFSDIHNYDLSYMPPKTDADIMICAGDFDMGSSVEKWANRVVEHHGIPFFIGFGNHDYWNTSKESYTIEEWIKLYESFNTTMIQFLERKTIVIDDVALIFATGWSDFDRDNNITKMSVQNLVKDFQKIKTDKGTLIPEDVYQEHLVARQFIIDELEKHSDKRCVVITHYPPSIQCNTSFQITAMSYYWCGQMEDVIEKYQPVAWIAGHMHNHFDRYIHNTRVLINPAGNVKNGKHQLDSFIDGFVLDLDNL